MRQKLKAYSAILTKDLPWKILSVALAAMLWFIIINVTNPLVSATTTVKLQLRSTKALTDEHKMIVNETALKATDVTVELRCKSKDMNDLKSKLDAYVDFSLFEMISARQTGQPLQTAVVVTKHSDSDDFEIIGYSPKTVLVTIDRKTTVTRPVSINTKTTVVPDGYVLAGYTAVPPTVQVSGAETQIAKIATVAIDVSLTDRTANFEADGKIRAYDGDGNDLLLELGETTGSAFVTINRLAQIPISPPSYIGEPASGYVVTGVTCDLEALDIMGDESELALLPSIKLAPIYIDGAAATVHKTYDLRNDLAGLKLNVVSGMPYECEVTVTVEHLNEKAFTIPMSEVTKAGYTAGAQILTESVTVRVAGTRTTLQRLTGLKASVNLGGLQNGLNEVPVEIAPISGVSVVEAATAHIWVGDDIPPTWPPPTLTPEPEPTATEAPQESPEPTADAE